MQLPVTRRLRAREETSIGPWALLGFGAGIAAGFLLSEVFGRSGKARVTRLVRTLARKPGRKESLLALAARVRAALAAESWLAGESIDSVPAGNAGLALRGWVPSRAIRTRSWRLAQSLAGPVPVVNRLLVRGEDDLPANITPEDEPRSA